MRKISHFSDGTASQYQSRKKTADLVNHKNNSGIAAEWHFFAISHRKVLVMLYMAQQNSWQPQQVFNVLMISKC
jgi:hypothetical protein